jgi:hypothetical protein
MPYAAQALAPVLDACGFDDGPRAWLAQQQGDAAVTLTLSVPGAAGRCWLHAPVEQEPEHFPVFARISVALQRALKNWVALAWFADPESYCDPSSAWPLLFYRSLRPFPGRPRSEFTYDIMGPGSIELVRRWNARRLARELGPIETLLNAAGNRPLARLYAPGQAQAVIAALRRQPRHLNALLSADTLFVNGFLRLAHAARAAAALSLSDSRRAARELVCAGEQVAALFNRRLRYLYAGRNFVPFGSLLLVEATAALAGERPHAVLRLSAGGSSRVFVNVQSQDEAEAPDGFVRSLGG